MTIVKTGADLVCEICKKPTQLVFCGTYGGQTVCACARCTGEAIVGVQRSLDALRGKAPQTENQRDWSFE